MTRDTLLIFGAMILAGLAMVPCVFLLLHSPFGDLLVWAGGLPSPIGEVAWFVLLGPVGIIGPSCVWVGCFWLPDRAARGLGWRG